RPSWTRGARAGGGQRLALALAREQLNGLLGALGSNPRPRLEVEVFELGGDSQYESTAISLLRLEELVRGFLISRETLSVRVLEGAQDPTPLLKEIRDDKVPVIVIDANASVARLVLSKAAELGMTSAFYKYILTTMDFPLLRLGGDAPRSVLGFSMFNTSHRFYPEFVRSLNMSWRESCERGPYPGPAVRGGPRDPRGDPEMGGRPTNPGRGPKTQWEANGGPKSFREPNDLGWNWGVLGGVQ
ncbi:hypothetical protein Q9233_017819, partial [Columba guinea]